MAGKPVGTIFVELDLDASRYTRGQQQLLKDAQGASSVLEKNFQNLGIKSAATMDLMRAKIQNSYEAITASAKASENDKLRAAEAYNSKLKALNAQQFGEQKNHIENIKSNWLAYAASIFATARSISQAIEMAASGSKFEKQAASFVNLADAAGTSSRKMLDDLKVVSRGMISEAELIGAAGKALLMGIRPGEITKLMEIAAATSKMTGQTMTEAFADITMGVARQSRMILDNLGIIVDAEKAYADYAKTLGKSAEALTDIEKRQAFMNAVVKSGDDMIRRLGASSGELEGVNKLIAAQANLWADVQKSVASMLDKELSGYAKMINWIDEKLKGMRASAGESSMEDAAKEIEMLRSLEAKGMAQPGSTMNKMSEFNRRWGGASEAELASAAAMKAWQKPDPMAGWREREGNYAANTEEQNKQFLKASEDVLKRVAEEAKKAQEAINQLHAEVKKLEDDFAASKIFSGESSNYERMQDMLRSDYQLSDMERRRNESLYGKPTDWAEADKAWAAYLNRVDEATRANEIFKDTMDVMSQSTANAFAGFVTGAKNFKDAFQDMVQSIVAGIARLMSQRFFEQAFGYMTTQAGAFFGGGASGWQPAFDPAVGPMVAQGGVFGPSGMIPFASGGVVSRPTVFPFARGTGLMGEAGPEAIMPLSRNSRGELGVKGGASDGATNVIVNNYTGQQVETRETRGPGGARQLEIMIGQALTKDGPAARALQSTYGIRRNGAMRG